MPDGVGSIKIHENVYALDRGGKWSGPDPLYAELLNLAFSPERHERGSTAVLPFGYGTVTAAAEKFGDPDPVLPKHQPSEPGRIH